MATHVRNPRKEFNFTLQFAPDPIDPWLAQEVNLPDIEIDVTEHGDANHDIKTGGRAKYGAITLNKLLTTTGSDNWFFDWAASVADTFQGGGLPPMAYWKTLVITELAEDGATAINTWICHEVWPSKINGQKLDRMSSDNSIESVELQVNRVEKI